MSLWGWVGVGGWVGGCVGVGVCVAGYGGFVLQVWLRVIGMVVLQV